MITKKLLINAALVSALFIANSTGFTLNSQIVKTITGTPIVVHFNHPDNINILLELNDLAVKLILCYLG